MNRRSIFFGLALAIGVPACVASGTGTLHVTGTTNVVYTEPPQPQVEVQTVARPNHIWVKGRWDWQNGKWEWIGGHWERERTGYAWTEGRWERRGNAWHWIEGRWVEGAATVEVRDHREGGGSVEVNDRREGGGTVEVHDHRQGGGTGTVEVRDHRGGGTVEVTLDINGEYPNMAPAIKVESAGPARAGFVWVAGNWTWKRGQGWVWFDGHWERMRAGKTWAAGRWELQGSRWTYIAGSWR